MKYKKAWAAFMAAGILLSAGMVTGGCGSAKNQQGQQQVMKVTTFKPFKSNTPINREYTGTIMALQEVPVRSKVSGTVMEKYISGGEKSCTGTTALSSGYKKLSVQPGIRSGKRCPG